MPCCGTIPTLYSSVIPIIQYWCMLYIMHQPLHPFVARCDKVCDNYHFRNHVLTFVLPVSWPSWSWSYGSWIYNYLYSQYLSPLTFESRLWRGLLDTTLWTIHYTRLNCITCISHEREIYYLLFMNIVPKSEIPDCNPRYISCNL
jgi:hypothetical protein